MNFLEKLGILSQLRGGGSANPNYLILRGFFFLELFDLGPPSFAKMHIYVYIADLHGEVGQNILNGQKNMLKR